ncbi:MAG: peptide chain release factor N(5)-glutamine methyltransferase [Turneriella sp.]|nr:peptide chain release factor N(5)-glutamine methyltransferase [Leptospiraceae bacterium]MCX7632383.1 peptide chain release factor N(5)-glutamine methyltransferase [Turneriella sp.]
MSPVLTLLEALKKAERYLADHAIASPRLEAQLLFSHVLGLSRVALFTQYDRPLSGAEIRELREKLQTKAKGVPTAYILGYREFYGRRFRVTPDVLIPRPETEELVAHILNRLQHARHIADAGAGSGVLGITLALELKAARLSLIDISGAALSVARENAQSFLRETGCAYYQADFCRADFSLPEKADLFVSNPPYVEPAEYATTPSLHFEPRCALVAEDFAAEHKALIQTAFRLLAPGGLFALETHPQKSHEAKSWLEQAGFSQVRVEKDLAGRPHFILAVRG